PGRGRGPGSDRLRVRPVPVPDPGDLFAVLPLSPRITAAAPLAAWVRQGAGLAGWGEAAHVTLPAGADRFAAAEKWLREVFDGAQVRDEVRARGTGPIAFGSFTFDDCSDGS